MSESEPTADRSIGIENDRSIPPGEWEWIGKSETDTACPQDGCGWVLEDSEDVPEHLERHHGIAPDGVQQVSRCWYCGEFAERRSVIAEHVREEHASEQRSC
jgi:hypothetical protein